MKPTDAALAKANEDALAKLRAERAAMDARLAAAYSGSAAEEKPAETIKPIPGPRFKMSGD